MTHILIILMVIVLVFFCSGGSSEKSRGLNEKEIKKQYLSSFRMYLCLKNKLLLYPPKEIMVNNGYHTLNLSAKSNLLPHKCINAGGISATSLVCTECLHHCELKLFEVVDLHMTFEEYRNLSNDELKKRLSIALTQEQFDALFS